MDILLSSTVRCCVCHHIDHIPTLDVVAISWLQVPSLPFSSEIVEVCHVVEKRPLTSLSLHRHVYGLSYGPVQEVFRHLTILTDLACHMHAAGRKLLPTDEMMGLARLGHYSSDKPCFRVFFAQLVYTIGFEREPMIQVERRHHHLSPCA